MEPRDSRRPGATRSRLKTERTGRPLPQASLPTSFQAPEASRFHTSRGPCTKTRRRHEEEISKSFCITCSTCNTCFLLMKKVRKNLRDSNQPRPPSFPGSSFFDQRLMPTTLLKSKGRLYAIERACRALLATFNVTRSP